MRPHGVSINVPLKRCLMFFFFFIHQARLTGWPPWVDSRSFSDAGSRPYVKDRGWEALIYDKRTRWSVKEMDFLANRANGPFLCSANVRRRYFKKCFWTVALTGNRFDFVLLISRTAELIATVRAFC